MPYNTRDDQLTTIVVIWRVPGHAVIPEYPKNEQTEEVEKTICEAVVCIGRKCINEDSSDITLS